MQSSNVQTLQLMQNIFNNLQPNKATLLSCCNLKTSIAQNLVRHGWPCHTWQLHLTPVTSSVILHSLGPSPSTDHSQWLFPGSVSPSPSNLFAPSFHSPSFIPSQPVSVSFQKTWCKSLNHSLHKSFLHFIIPVFSITVFSLRRGQ